MTLFLNLYDDIYRIVPLESTDFHFNFHYNLTVLVFVGTSLEILTDHVNSRLREIFELCNCNKLSLNQAESELMTVTNKIVVNCPKLFIGSDPIKKVDSFKYLGIHVDPQLKFDVQGLHVLPKYLLFN